MAGFHDKSEGVKTFVKSLALNPDAFDTTTKDSCATCGDEVNRNDFTDDLALKEYTISLMCQTCQDKVFGKPTD
jgi:DNA-directed RNA polymerase subunit RPC12/RpoP|tara:strand:+ start:643 stop:864 length:222 start_codon:yes stop_codon:yes gene_type:complete